jgi:hypothetical protein
MNALRASTDMAVHVHEVIVSRRYHFKRCVPTFGIDKAEVYKLASLSCSLALAIDCLRLGSSARHTTRVFSDYVTLRPKCYIDLRKQTIHIRQRQLRRMILLL